MAQQPEKRENSVLFSLRELKQIEQTRVAEEEQAARNAEMARVRAKEEEERRKREAEEARVRAQQDEERRIRDDAEQRAREDALRIQEAEARARADAQHQLEAQRLQQELEIRRTEANKKRPIKLIAAAATLLVVIAGFVAYQFIKKADTAQEKQVAAEKNAAEAQRKSDELLAQVNKMQMEMEEGNKQIGDAQKAVESAQGDADRARANERLSALRKAQAERAERLAVIKDKQEKEARKVKINQKCVDNPLGC